VEFWNLVCRAADRVPDRILLSDDHGRSLTTSAFRDAAERVAAGLALRPGVRVSWQLPTTLEAMVLMAALNRAGADQNPIIPMLREREVGLILSQVEPALYIGPESWAGFEFAEMGRRLGCEVLALDLAGEVGAAIRLPTGDIATLNAPADYDTEWIYYSSGTTSDPKGARHTDASLIASVVALIEQAEFGEGDVYPIAWPVTHIGGVSMLSTSLVGGMQLVLFDAWDPVTTPERMTAHAPTILGSAQHFFRAYVDAQDRRGDERVFPELRVCTAGGAPTPPEIVRDLIATFGVRGVVGSYGLTEFPVATAARSDDAPDVMLRTVGKPPRTVEVRLVQGEVRLKGPQCFAGYVDSALDEAAFDDEGWLRSGDLGEFDADGNLVITGRLKDVVIRNAENISALEIEDVLLRHPGVADVAVIGLPDARTGERVCAVVVPEDGAFPDVAALAAHCLGAGLARYKCPEQVEIADRLERNATGKLLKQKMRDSLLS
jgi:cyclohexanecarboxylate-CoA ligase